MMLTKLARALNIHQATGRDSGIILYTDIQGKERVGCR